MRVEPALNLGESIGSTLVHGLVNSRTIEIEKGFLPVPTVVFTDGGVIKKNPSEIGGTWAWIWTWSLPENSFSGHSDQSLYGCGYVWPDDDVGGSVSNNLTEFYAVLDCLEHLPSGWSGVVASDSGVTIQRFRDGAKCNGIPKILQDRMHMVLGRLGNLHWQLLGGHPTRADLDAGKRKKDGKLVSRHNVWCDQVCGYLASLVNSGDQD